MSKFLTKSYDTLKLLASSPAKGDETTIKPVFQLLFDSKLESGECMDRIYVMDERDSILDKAARTQEWNKAGDYGTYKFDVTADLVEGKTYRLVIEEYVQNRDGITVREKREIPFIAVNFTEPLLEKAVDCATAVFAYNATNSEGVSKAKVAVDSKTKLFAKSNKFTYTFANEEDAYVVYTLNSPIDVENGLDLTIPFKGDFTHNDVKLKCVNEDSSDSVLVDFVTLSGLNWTIEGVKIEGLPEDGKKWQLRAVVVEKSGHPANEFDGEFFIENIYLGTYNKVATEQVVVDGVSVWPTVVTDVINVEAPASATIEVYSVDGRMFMSLPAVGDSNDSTLRTLDVNNFATGVYIVNIATVEGTQAVKFVKE